ncbi:menaquinone biosynthesis protein [Pedobacter sp. BS3]|uniref:menaquinone biosynthetic enzyme MqnA/MqnD family protein n=1 Tax=Pedobacter sp. BS3 TaxID=2567937 RepID=UPI0011EF506D|nr:menaquinone biosynthesis protein [Pedobacter sp. BS3]TZF83822.1 menaquinone biosynthesis protein [Pedobacter sp. BS3]
MSTIRVSAVSYTNTSPFVYGIQHAEVLNKIDLSLDIPSDCARKLIDNQADIGLVPAVALLQIPDAHIVSDFCIGAVGPVNSVFIFSNKPIRQIKTIRSDSQSRTSNSLSRVLLKNYWQHQPQWVSSGQADAFVEIGDRTFGKTSQYPYVYDLAEEWINFTGLPFVFAVWAANKPISQDFIDEFNQALQYGLNHREEVVAGLPPRADFDLHDYLTNRIDYALTPAKRQGLNKFLALVQALDTVELPG